MDKYNYYISKIMWSGADPFMLMKRKQYLEQVEGRVHNQSDNVFNRLKMDAQERKIQEENSVFAQTVSKLQRRNASQISGRSRHGSIVSGMSSKQSRRGTILIAPSELGLYRIPEDDVASQSSFSSKKSSNVFNRTLKALQRKKIDSKQNRIDLKILEAERKLNNRLLLSNI